MLLPVWTNGITIGKVVIIGNPAGIGQGTGFGLRERDWDGIGLGHYRLRTSSDDQCGDDPKKKGSFLGGLG